jgi:hypothetical protein
MKKGTVLFHALLAVLLAASAPEWPDDWDGLGLVAAVTRFDLERFAPHAPGYPVWVAAAKALAAVLRSPFAAATAVSVLAGVGTFALVRDGASRAFGAGRGVVVALAVTCAPLVWRAESGVGSEGLALFFAALAAWALAREHALWLGLAVGLGLGVRASWAPFYLALLVLGRQDRLRALGAAAAAVAAWAVPFVLVVGPTRVVPLLTTHLAGHATRWGGTAITDPGLGRLADLGRDVFFDGLGAGTDPLGIAVGGAVVAVAFVGLTEWRLAGWAGAKTAAIALGPYLVWILLGQNLRQQPRHALPIVAAVAGALALATMSVDRGRRLGVALFTVVSIRTFADGHERRTVPPPGVQLVQAVRELPEPSRVAVFGGPSVRFFETTNLAGDAQAAGSMGDVRLALGRMSTLPLRVLVTAELAGYDAPPYPATPFKRLCRPERLDRRAPCLDVVELKVPFLPKE